MKVYEIGRRTNKDCVIWIASKYKLKSISEDDFFYIKEIDIIKGINIHEIAGIDLIIE